ncbi:hypothetical protein PHMEG_00028028 [Phytophthora megakarya]|uniref:SAP domain-containing protein n=1 Tax=Phytophthora megakarya TaxID=4795 RepID=A0A225V5V3_9STRA|nr:hypothetical protein PHMEG_00028028 [Phytophthora megakarya]
MWRPNLSKPPCHPDLEGMTNEDLRSLCRDKEFPISGNKSTLIERLCRPSRRQTMETSTSISGELLSSWFMTPSFSSATKIETHNEPRISAHIQPFLKAHSAFVVEKVKSYGLLCARGIPCAAFSPDDIAAVSSDDHGKFHAVFEYKTRVNDQTEQQETILAERFGVFAKVELMSNGLCSNFKDLVPDGGHRSQILHNIIGDDDAATYQRVLLVISDAYMEWVYDEIKEVPYFSIDELGHCVDASTLSQNLALWRALVRIIEQRGHPLPAAKHILPSLVSLWNRIKGGIDIFSRHLKNVHSHHIALTSMAAIWLRVIGTLICNAYQSHQCFKAQHYLDDTVRCTTFSSLQHYKQSLPSFGSFCRDAAIALKASLPAHPVLQPPNNADSTADSTTFEVDNAGVAYKKWNHFNLNEDWIRHRLSKVLKHDVVSIVLAKNYTLSVVSNAITAGPD